MKFKNWGACVSKWSVELNWVEWNRVDLSSTVRIVVCMCHEKWLLSQIYHIFESSIHSSVTQMCYQFLAGVLSVHCITSCHDETKRVIVSNQQQAAAAAAAAAHHRIKLNCSIGIVSIFYTPYYFNMFHVVFAHSRSHFLSVSSRESTILVDELFIGNNIHSIEE